VISQIGGFFVRTFTPPAELDAKPHPAHPSGFAYFLSGGYAATVIGLRRSWWSIDLAMPDEAGQYWFRFKICGTPATQQQRIDKFIREIKDKFPCAKTDDSRSLGYWDDYVEAASKRALSFLNVLL
jgi:hypothetical protein